MKTGFFIFAVCLWLFFFAAGGLSGRAGNLQYAGLCAVTAALYFVAAAWLLGK